MARVPAHPLEQVVREHVHNTLEKGEHTEALAKRLDHMSETERHQVLRQIIQRVVIARGTLRISLNVSQGQSLLDSGKELDPEEAQATTQIEVPFTLVPRGGKTRILVNGTADETRSEPNAVLIQAVVRGYQWRQQLQTGPETSLKEFAKRQGVLPRYLMRLLRVGFLAPDILEGIVNGTQSPTMTLERFRRPISLDWAQQRQLFRFPSR